MENDPSLAVLISGGLDSAILLGTALREHQAVHPLYVRFGLAWEADELLYLRRFLDALVCPVLRPLTVLELPVIDLYGRHWSVTGENVPDASTPDEAVYLPGRNLLLLAKAVVWCHLHDVPAVALGSLGTNPFADATPQFFRDFEKTAGQALSATVHIRRPLSGLKKLEVMRLGRDLPIEHTFSCIQPVNHLHCGVCNKCAERRHAFSDAGLPDPTRYQVSS